MINIFFKRDYFAENRFSTILSFTLNMIIEEIVFRYYLLGIILNYLDYSMIETFNSFNYIQVFYFFIPILLSAVIFSIYHIHIYFWTKSAHLTAMFIVMSFFLGLLLGLVFIYCGVIFAVIIHWISVYFAYKLIAFHYSVKEKEDSSLGSLDQLRKI
ncbi:MAG: CPBP family glutamic-type intramembrane protease [Promethearchaeota archaeon]